MIWRGSRAAGLARASARTCYARSTIPGTSTNFRICTHHPLNRYGASWQLGLGIGDWELELVLGIGSREFLFARQNDPLSDVEGGQSPFRRVAAPEGGLSPFLPPRASTPIQWAVSYFLKDGLMLDFDLTEEQRILEQSVREWGAKE